MAWTATVTTKNDGMVRWAKQVVTNGDDDWRGRYGDSMGYAETLKVMGDRMDSRKSSKMMCKIDRRCEVSTSM